MKKISRLSPLVIGLIMAPILSAQGILERDIVPLKNWDAPMYWQPSAVESKDAAEKQLLAGNSRVYTTSDITPAAQTPANSLVFVGMTPCRVVDTRTGSGFTGAFGPPILVGGVGRTFPIQSSTTCSIPSVAQAYSFNITVVPPGFLDFITVWPTGQVQPNASTLNSYVGTVIANAAIVPAGTNGSIDVFASQNTHLAVDINGYYAAQSGITLAQGNAGAPSLSFAGDAGTGIYSSGVGNLNIATAGASRLNVSSNGNVGIGVPSPNAKLDVVDSAAQIRFGNTNGDEGGYLTSVTPSQAILSGGAKWNGSSWIAKSTAASLIQNLDGAISFYTNSNLTAGTMFGPEPRMLITNDGRVGIGTTMPQGKLHAEGPGVGVIGITSSSDIGVYGGSSSSGTGVYGTSTSGAGVYGHSLTGYGVYGSGGQYAAYFQGNVHVTGTLSQNSDARLKQEVTNLGYGLREVLQLRPVTWNWKDKPGGGRHLGLIAQEVETVLPELVSTDKDAEQTKGLNYIGLVPLTIKAIQEQQVQIEAEQKRNAEQQECISEQQEQLEEQRRQIDSLKLLVCLDHPEATVCK